MARKEKVTKIIDGDTFKTASRKGEVGSFLQVSYLGLMDRIWKK